MVLSTAVKAGLGTVLVAGGIAGAAIGVTSMSKHPENVQRILDWEKNNGGCRIHMVVTSSGEGVLYRVGEGDKKGIEDKHLDALYKDSTGRNRESNKRSCEASKGKDLVFADRGGLGWKKDTNPEAIQKWKKKLGDNLA